MEMNFSYSLRKGVHIFLSFFLVSYLFISPLSISAQKNGQITGRVYDAETKEYLPGANVVLKGTAFGAATDRSGNYRISNIPPGNYVLVASYIGFEDTSFDIVIDEKGFTVNQDLALKASEVKMQEVTILGLRQGQTKALNVQKTASNIMNVVSEEQIESFPDINSAEVLQRVPGITILRDQGEGRYVQIRGTEARLNTMKVNGETIPSPEGEIRQVQMDIIPADQLSSIEVIKAITPDMDGDAIGGTVNLITKSALDYEKPVLNVTAGGGYADISGKGIYQRLPLRGGLW